MSGPGCQKKRRRTVYPRLEHVSPILSVQPAAEPPRGGMPTFLRNVLLRAPVKVPHGKCPFEQYIPLGQRAWKKEGEPMYLIERPGYVGGPF